MTDTAGSSDSTLGFSTRAIHAGARWNPTSSLVPPIVQSSTFRLESAAAGARFALETAPAEFYTRWGNPTTKQAEAVLASLEGAEAALLFASGMGAISALLSSTLSVGDHVIFGRSVYSGTHEFATNVLPARGIESSLVDARDPSAIEAAVGPTTRLIWVETPSNPRLEICDLRAIAAIGRARGLLTVVDGTFASPWNQRPIELGIDAVVHSGTKYLGGHSDLTAGVICSRADVIERAWRELKLTGAPISPFEAWLLLRGLKTLALRVERQSSSALSIARWLAREPGVRRVYYPGLEDHPGHDIARLQMRAFGGMVSFEIEGSAEDAARFAESLRIITLAVSLGGAESVIQHPASMSHATVSEDALRAAGISPSFLRLSVGLEDPDDLVADIAQALRQARAH